MRFALSLALAAALASPAAAQQCGGSFNAFLGAFKAQAIARGYPESTVNAFLANVRQDQKVLRADRAQGVFQMPFIDFSRRLISQNRIDNGRRNAERYDAIFDEVERRYGVSRGILLAFWAFETDYGQAQGDFNTVNALLTLAHDCRRPQLFLPQAYAALELYARGDIDPARTTGAWAGEIGMVQMLPADILENGVDGDGDGHITLKTSVADALLSGGKMLRGLGWRPNEPWMIEVVVPDTLDWSQTGLNHPRRAADWQRQGVRARTGSLPGNLQGSILLPQGRKGPAFMVFPNFDVLFEWNKSFVYVTTAAYFATRLEGAPVYDAGNPDPGLSDAQMKDLQRKLQARGHDVGAVDGILGERTREAVQTEQERLGLPADAWPTPDLLRRL